MTDLAGTHAGSVIGGVRGTGFVRDIPPNSQILDGNVRYFNRDFEWSEIVPSAQATLLNDTSLLPEEDRVRLEAEGATKWDVFYSRHASNFFKDRHYLHAGFPELDPAASHPVEDGKQVLVEIGSGAGNTVFSLLRINPRLFIVALDYSPRAIAVLTSRAEFDAARCRAAVWDVEAADVPEDIVPPASADFVTLVFALSAMAPHNMPSVLGRINQVLKEGGLVLFRDYGLYDLAQLRFSAGHKLADNYYVRGDGTRAFYFSREHLEELFRKSGFVVEECEYCTIRNVNRRRNVAMHRVWITAKCRKVSSSVAPVYDSLPLYPSTAPAPESHDDSTNCVAQPPCLSTAPT